MKKPIREARRPITVFPVSSLSCVVGGSGKTKTSDKNQEAVMDFIKG